MLASIRFTPSMAKEDILHHSVVHFNSPNHNLILIFISNHEPLFIHRNFLSFHWSQCCSRSESTQHPPCNSGKLIQWIATQTTQASNTQTMQKKFHENCTNLNWHHCPLCIRRQQCQMTIYECCNVPGGKADKHNNSTQQFSKTERTHVPRRPCLIQAKNVQEGSKRLKGAKKMYLISPCRFLNVCL